MRIRVGRFEPAQIGRISQLFLRSNQFNLTTHRYTEAQCTAMMEDEALHPALRELDRSVRRSRLDFDRRRVARRAIVMRISDWLMSCRVLGRGVEEYLMNHLLSMARERAH